MALSTNMALALVLSARTDGASRAIDNFARKSLKAIEDPFGDDYDDLPIDKIVENIDKHVKEIIRL